MFGFLKHKGFVIKAAGCFHTIIIFLFISFRVARHIQTNSNISNIITLILGFVSLLLLYFYFLSRNSRIKNLGVYGQSKCFFSFNLGLSCSLLSWVIFMIVNLLSIFLESEGKFIWYSYVGLVLSFLFSCMSMSFFGNLEKRLI